MMKDKLTSTKTAKRFTIEEANAMLPLVRSIAADICNVFRSVTGRRADLHRILRKGSLSSGQQYDDEIAESRADLQEEYDLIWQYREELESLGVLLRHPEQGQIEFPAVVLGREAYFSWHLGEESIRHWRDADSPNSTRKLLPTLENAN
ncbi:MAG: DUF2203 family protein [Planctomycetales bacterium]|nr:DUF2203 family protein [Planctomycetales bacterium]